MDNRIEKVAKWCGYKYELPNIDSPELLYWLFKYPVAKLSKGVFIDTDFRFNFDYENQWECYLANNEYDEYGNGNKPAEALLEAIIQVIDKE